MTITSWNIRGLNNKGEQRYLKERLKKDRPSIMVAQETKISEWKLKVILENFKPKFQVMGQDVCGSAGGLAIIWNPENVFIKYWVILLRILSGKVQKIGSKEWVLLTSVYGPHILGERRDFLKKLANMRNIYPKDLWIARGDFNMITNLAEKKGGMQRVDTNMKAFGETISDLYLVDMQRIDDVHTWNNRRGGIHQITSWLDRFLILEQVIRRDIFMEASILPCMGLDHWSRRLEVDLKARPENRPFRFQSF